MVAPCVKRRRAAEGALAEQKRKGEVVPPNPAPVVKEAASPVRSPSRSAIVRKERKKQKVEEE